VHSIAASLLLKSSEVHYFYDMGYFHDPILHCPSEPSWLPKEKCSCDPSESVDRETDFSCHAEFLRASKKQATDYIITSRDPRL
jgi:alpha 1,2-mannosyltransferase